MKNTQWKGMASILFGGIAAARANAAYIKGAREKARPMLRRCVEKQTRNVIVYVNYADLLLRDGDATEALHCLHTAQTLNPHALVEKNIRLMISTCHWVMGDIDEAIAALEQMRKDYEYVNESVLTSLGYFYLTKGDYAAAHELTDKAIEDAPTYAAAWDNRGQIFAAQGEDAQAKEAFTKALEYNSTLVDSLYGMGLIYEAAGEHDEAVHFFRRAAEAPISALNTVEKEEIVEKVVAYNILPQEENKQ